MDVTYLLDTSWAVRHLRGQSDIVTKIAELQPEGVGISIITLAELEVGVVRAGDPVKARDVLERFVASLIIFDITRPICQLFAEWSVRLQRRGEGLEHFDVLIAATAIHHHLTLCTTNYDHFERFEGPAFLPCSASFHSVTYCLSTFNHASVTLY